MGPHLIYSFSGKHAPVAGTLAALALLLLCAVLTPTDARATSAYEAALQARLPVAVKVTPREAGARIHRWQAFVARMRHGSDADKVKAVNHYFNALRFINDERLWRVADYWATPLQVLAAGAGDCEDIAIAKYFTLRTLGIADQRLRLTYVWNSATATGRRAPHMVLTYTANDNAEPQVLDILTNTIETMASRPELEPVYSVNALGLWLVGDNAKLIPAGSPLQLAQWRVLSHEMASDTGLLLGNR